MGVEVKSDISWIVTNYENIELEAKAIKETIELCVNEKNRQQVVNDSLQSFRNERIDESNQVELMAKHTLIEVANTKYIKEEQKVALVELLVERCYKGYEVDYAYIFDKQVA